MNVLAFDTCFDACSAAAVCGLGAASSQIARRFEPMAIGHAERLLPMIAEVLSELGLEIKACDRIVLTIGPGTFTGTRISVAAGKALALATNVPLVTLTSLELMALSPGLDLASARAFAIATDARRGEVYVERFDPVSRRALAPAQVLGAHEAALLLPPEGAVVAGSGASLVANAATEAGRNVIAIAPDLLPNAADLFTAAFDLNQAACRHPRDILPLYLRAPDAKPPAAAAIARGGP